MSIMLLGDFVSPSKIVRRNNKDVPFLSMSREEGLVIDKNNKTSGNTLETSKIASYGQLVLGLHMDEGSIWVQNTTKEGAVSRAYDVLDVNLKLVDPEYMNYALHTDECMQFYRGAGIGSTIRRSKVPWDSLKTMPIKVPSLEQQKESVDLIKRTESLRHDIQNALSIISIIEGSLFEENTKDSDPVLIENLAKLTFGKTPMTTSELQNDPFPYISGASDFGEVFTEGTKKVTSAERIVEGDSVLISVREPVGKVNITTEKCAIGRGIVGATPKSEITTSSYIYLALKKKERELDSIAYGIIKGIGPKEVKEIAIDCVEINKQRRITKLFQELEKIRVILKKMLISANGLYKKILQERFSCSEVA